MIAFILLLSGCTQVREPITAESEGIWNSFFVYPMSQLITYFANLFKGSYGLAIIVVTIIIRLILLPLNVKQIRSSKAMQDIQPELKALQEKYQSRSEERRVGKE